LLTAVKFCIVDSEKDAELQHLTVTQQQQAALVQKTLDDFKLQVENSSVKMYEDMKLQVCHATSLPLWLFYMTLQFTSR